jgi:hypothetical protein
MNLAEAESRIITLENKINQAVELPTVAVKADDTTIADKTGYKVFGIIAGINSGKYCEFISSEANPTTEAHVERFVYKSIV